MPARRRTAARSKEGHGEAGFTLLEVMIAFAILATGLLTLLLGQASAMRVTGSSKNWSQAMNLAEEQMEIFQAQPWSVFFTTAVIDQQDPGNPLAGNPYGPPGNQDADQYFRSWSITPNQPAPNLSQITVTVRFSVGHGNSRSVSLTSVKGP